MIISLHPAQAAFVRSNATYRGYVGGRGAGKSYVGAYDMIKRAKPSRLYMAAAPTYPLMRDATLRSFLSLAEELRYLKDFKRGDMTATLGNQAQVIFRSAEDPDRTMRGPNLSGVWLDEASVMDALAYEISIASLREGGEQGWLSSTFTPRGKLHFTYQVFGMGKADTALFQSRTQDNPFLPAGFEDIIRRQYTSSFARQELEGQFIDPVGALARREWFGIAPARPAGPSVRFCRAWDFAATAKTSADYLSGVLLAVNAGSVTVCDVVRVQVGPGAVESIVEQTAALDGTATAIVLEEEPGSAGKLFTSSLIKRLAGYNVRTARPTGDKVTRAMPFLAQAEAGNVKLYGAAWNQDYLDELLSFPEGDHDDQVDATAHAYGALAHGMIMPTVGTGEMDWLTGRAPIDDALATAYSDLNDTEKEQLDSWLKQRNQNLTG